MLDRYDETKFSAGDHAARQAGCHQKKVFTFFEIKDLFKVFWVYWIQWNFLELIKVFELFRQSLANAFPNPVTRGPKSIRLTIDDQ